MFEDKIPQSYVVALSPLEDVEVMRSHVGVHKRKTQGAKKVQQSVIKVPP